MRHSSGDCLHGLYREQIVEVQIPQCGRRVAMPEQATYRQHGLALSQGEAGVGVSEVVEAHIRQSGRRPNVSPVPVQGFRAHGTFVPPGRKDPGRRPFESRQDEPARAAEPHRSWSGLAVAKVQITFPVFVPPQMPNLALAAAGEDQQAHKGSRVGGVAFAFGKYGTESMGFRRGEKAAASRCAVAPYTRAGIAVLGTKSQPFRFVEHSREHRQGAVRRSRRGVQGSEPLPDLARRDFRNRSLREERQDLIAQIAAIDRQRARLPQARLAIDDRIGQRSE